jgi:hypothetical protein
MGQLKPWQAVLFVIALASMAFAAWWMLRPDVKLADGLRMVDVNTGELFTVPIGKGGATIPGRNPKTEQMTLMPVYEEKGALLIPSRYFSAMKDIPGDHSAIDTTTRSVKAAK